MSIKVLFLSYKFLGFFLDEWKINYKNGSGSVSVHKDSNQNIYSKSENDFLRTTLV